MAMAVAATVATLTAHDPITTRVSWDREIAPIVQARCVSCHSPDGPAPMSLATYTDARPWARAIREEVLARRMPKWPVVRGYGDFRNDPSLSAFEIALITAWVDGGAPQSLKKDAPALQPVALQTAADRRPEEAAPLTLPCRSQALGTGRLFAIKPQLPAKGSLRLTLEFSDGTVEPLVSIREFDPRFSQPLELRSPVSIPDGTRLVVDGAPDACAVALFGDWT
ncbi:MAG TPA: cytochrome c [Vicinamibacterales bacterium]|nr:cytochrome c [Vicinamibacterales bacterium]